VLDIFRGRAHTHIKNLWDEHYSPALIPPFLDLSILWRP
jgi:hypothetical protein